MSTYQDELKRELFQKIAVYYEAVDERDKMEEDAAEQGIGIHELFESDDDYAGLEVRVQDLADKIQKIMIEVKSNPLLGLSIDQKKDFDFFKDWSDKNFSANFDDYQRDKAPWIQEQMRERLQKIPAIGEGFHMPPRERGLYRQVVLCYQNGCFEASSILCRAIVQAVAERLIRFRSRGDLLVGPNRGENQLSLMELLKQVETGISPEVISCGMRIIATADELLHKSDRTSGEKEALKIIRDLQLYLQKIPKTASL